MGIGDRPPSRFGKKVSAPGTPNAEPRAKKQSTPPPPKQTPDVDADPHAETEQKLRQAEEALRTFEAGKSALEAELVETRDAKSKAEQELAKARELIEKYEERERSTAADVAAGIDAQAGIQLIVDKLNEVGAGNPSDGPADRIQALSNALSERPPLMPAERVKIQKLERENAELMTKVTHLENTTATDQERIRTLKAEIQAAQREAEAQKQRAVESEQKESQLDAEFKRQLADLRAVAPTGSSAADQAELKRLREKETELTGKITRVEHQLSTVQTEKTVVNDQLAQAKHQLQAYINERNAIGAKLAKAITEWKIANPGTTLIEHFEAVFNHAILKWTENFNLVVRLQKEAVKKGKKRSKDMSEDPTPKTDPPTDEPEEREEDNENVPEEGGEETPTEEGKPEDKKYGRIVTAAVAAVCLALALYAGYYFGQNGSSSTDGSSHPGDEVTTAQPTSEPVATNTATPTATAAPTQTTAPTATAPVAPPDPSECFPANHENLKMYFYQDVEPNAVLGHVNTTNKSRIHVSCTQSNMPLWNASSGTSDVTGCQICLPSGYKTGGDPIPVNDKSIRALTAQDSASCYVFPHVWPFMSFNGPYMGFNAECTHSAERYNAAQKCWNLNGCTLTLPRPTTE